MSSTESKATESETFDIAPLLGDVFDGLTLSQERAEWVMGHLMDAQLSQMQAAALLFSTVHGFRFTVSGSRFPVHGSRLFRHSRQS